MTRARIPAPARTRAVTALLAIVPSLLLMLASGLIVWAWRHELPTPVASHWGADGRADGFSSLAGLAGLWVGLTLAMLAIFVAIGLIAPGDVSVRRMSTGISAGMTAFLTTLIVGSLSLQRGLADARDVEGIGWTLALAMGVGLAVGILVAALTPRGEPPRVIRTPGRGDGTRVAWVARVTSPPLAVAAGVGAAVVLIVALLTQAWALLVLAVVLLVLLASTAAWVVRIDVNGVSVTSALGFPRRHIPLATIADAAVVHVEPVGDFGGWGWRIGRDATLGVVLRKGPALLVTDSAGARFAVTMPHADEALDVLHELLADAPLSSV